MTGSLARAYGIMLPVVLQAYLVMWMSCLNSVLHMQRGRKRLGSRTRQGLTAVKVHMQARRRISAASRHCSRRLLPPVPIQVAVKQYQKAVVSKARVQHAPRQKRNKDQRSCRASHRCWSIAQKMTEAPQYLKQRLSQQQQAKLTFLKAEGLEQRMQTRQLNQAPRALSIAHALGVKRWVARRTCRANRMLTMCGSRQRSAKC